MPNMYNIKNTINIILKKINTLILNIKTNNIQIDRNYCIYNNFKP